MHPAQEIRRLFGQASAVVTAGDRATGRRLLPALAVASLVLAGSLASPDAQASDWFGGRNANTSAQHFGQNQAFTAEKTAVARVLVVNEAHFDRQVGTAGTAIGGIGGFLLGRGLGHRNVAAEVVGAVGGAIAGRTIQQRTTHQDPGVSLTLIIPQGPNRAAQQVTITQSADQNIRAGDYVLVEGGGRNARVRTCGDQEEACRDLYAQLSGQRPQPMAYRSASERYATSRDEDLQMGQTRYVGPAEETPVASPSRFRR